MQLGDAFDPSGFNFGLTSMSPADLQYGVATGSIIATWVPARRVHGPLTAHLPDGRVYSIPAFIQPAHYELTAAPPTMDFAGG